MSVRGCVLGRSAREIRRLHYCGACKAIGREYGQSSRLLLNHDTVLVAELITALTQAPEWGAAIESRNCFKLPKTAETPPVLRYAAAATVLLASAKAQDHASDSGKLRWRVAARWLNPQYRRAATELRGWGVPVSAIERQLATQQGREAAPESLEQLAEPTCFATAEICRHAAAVAARPKLGTKLGTTLGTTLERFGRRFGYLIYLLDAWEDFDKDIARGDFNAFQALYGNRGFARIHVETAAQAVVRSFQELPITDGFRNELMVRFQSNFTTRFHPLLPVIGQPMFATASLALAGVPIAMAPVTPNKRPSGGFFGAVRGTCCSGCDDSCCDGCCDSGCSSCDCS